MKVILKLGRKVWRNKILFSRQKLVADRDQNGATSFQVDPDRFPESCSVPRDKVAPTTRKPGRPSLSRVFPSQNIVFVIYKLHIKKRRQNDCFYVIRVKLRGKRPNRQ